MSISITGKVNNTKVTINKSITDNKYILDVITDEGDDLTIVRSELNSIPKAINFAIEHADEEGITSKFKFKIVNTDYPDGKAKLSYNKGPLYNVSIKYDNGHKAKCEVDSLERAITELSRFTNEA